MATNNDLYHLLSDLAMTSEDDVSSDGDNTKFKFKLLCRRGNDASSTYEVLRLIKRKKRIDSNMFEAVAETSEEEAPVTEGDKIIPPPYSPGRDEHAACHGFESRIERERSTITVLKSTLNSLHMSEATSSAPTSLESSSSSSSSNSSMDDTSPILPDDELDSEDWCTTWMNGLFKPTAEVSADACMKRELDEFSLLVSKSSKPRVWRPMTDAMLPLPPLVGGHEFDKDSLPLKFKDACSGMSGNPLEDFWCKSGTATKINSRKRKGEEHDLYFTDV